MSLSTSCSTRAFSTRIATSTSLSNTPRPEPEDILIRITVHNRGPEDADLHVLPTLWFRNTWSWGDGTAKPSLREAKPGMVLASHEDLGARTLCCDGNPELLFTENESNAQRLWDQPNPSPYVKDAFHTSVVTGNRDALNPSKTGTKAAAHYRLKVPAGGHEEIRLRLCTNAAGAAVQLVRRQFFQRAWTTRTNSMSRITPPDP